MTWTRRVYRPKDDRHRHRCGRCGKEFLCWKTLCPGKRECDKKRCTERKL